VTRLIWAVSRSPRFRGASGPAVSGWVVTVVILYLIVLRRGRVSASMCKELATAQGDHLHRSRNKTAPESGATCAIWRAARQMLGSQPDLVPISFNCLPAIFWNLRLHCSFRN